MPDKDSKAKPAWGKSEAGLAGFIPFDGPKAKFYPPWKIPKPVDVPQIPLGNFHDMHSAPSVWGLKNDVAKNLETWPAQTPPIYANRIPSAFHLGSGSGEDPLALDSWPSPFNNQAQGMDKYGRYAYALPNTGYNPLPYTGEHGFF